jgi:hypothetical protein
MPARERVLHAQNENRHRRERSAQRTKEDNPSTSHRRGYSRIDTKINADEDKRQSQVYVPTHAADDFVRVPVSRSLKDRYTTMIDEEQGRRLSRMLAQLSPSRESDDGSPRSSAVDDRYRDEQRRLTIATLEGISNVDTDSSFGNEAAVTDTLQPPPTPSRPYPPRRSRHSYVLAEDSQQLAGLPEEPSDYQRFLKNAFDHDRREQDELWRTAINRHNRRSFTPVHPDVVKPCALQRSDTFGGGRRDRSRSKKRDDTWKRASHYSYQSRDDRKRRSHIGDDGRTQSPFDRSQKDLRKSTSAAKHLSDYFRPPRNVIMGYE